MEQVEEEEVQGYEITQVDHINKAMLDTFKQHLEANDLPLLQVEDTNTEVEGEAEWSD
jgi:hypothetical protein